MRSAAVAHPVTRPEVIRGGPARGGLRRGRALLTAGLALLALEARGPGGKVVRAAAGTYPVAGAEVTRRGTARRFGRLGDVARETTPTTGTASFGVLALEAHAARRKVVSVAPGAGPVAGATDTAAAASRGSRRRHRLLLDRGGPALAGGHHSRGGGRSRLAHAEPGKHQGEVGSLRRRELAHGLQVERKRGDAGHARGGVHRAIDAAHHHRGAGVVVTRRAHDRLVDSHRLEAHLRAGVGDGDGARLDGGGNLRVLHNLEARAPLQAGAHLGREAPVVGVGHAVHHLAELLGANRGQDALEVGHQRRQALSPSRALLGTKHVPGSRGRRVTQHADALGTRG